jgi:hypothetical protein
LGYQICAVCCGTKRLVEINCPSDCGYLASSKAHPPAVIQRQQERDMIFTVPMLQELTTRQRELLLLLQSFLRSHQPSSLAIVDSDIAQASLALAETYETASRGIIYEHTAKLAAAAQLGSEIKTLIERTREKGFTISDAAIATVLRRMERAAKVASSSLPGNETAYVDWLKRVFGEDGAAAKGSSEKERQKTEGSSLIVPGR